MSASLRTGAGLAVLCSGLLVLAGIQFGRGSELTPAPAQPAAAPVTTIAGPPEVAGLTPSVQATLASAGKLEQLSIDRLPMFPPPVARVLVGYGVVLATPEGGQ